MLVIPNACEGPRKRLNAPYFSKSWGHGKVPRKLGMTYSALSVTNFASITVVTEI